MRKRLGRQDGRLEVAVMEGILLQTHRPTSSRRPEAAGGPSMVSGVGSSWSGLSLGYQLRRISSGVLEPRMLQVVMSSVLGSTFEFSAGKYR
jgi:hypothetical protein